MLACLLLAPPMHGVSNSVFILLSQGTSPKPAAGPEPAPPGPSPGPSARDDGQSTARHRPCQQEINGHKQGKFQN